MSSDEYLGYHDESFYVPPPTRLTRRGYIALSVSLLSALGQFASFKLVGSISFARWLEGLPDWIHYSLFNVLLILLLASIPAGISLDAAAANYGRPNRIAGRVGGTMLIAAPLWYIAFVVASQIMR